jgi:hypothetical protein
MVTPIANGQQRVLTYTINDYTNYTTKISGVDISTIQLPGVKNQPAARRAVVI